MQSSVLVSKPSIKPGRSRDAAVSSPGGPALLPASNRRDRDVEGGPGAGSSRAEAGSTRGAGWGAASAMMAAGDFSGIPVHSHERGGGATGMGRSPGAAAGFDGKDMPISADGRQFEGRIGREGGLSASRSTGRRASFGEPLLVGAVNDPLEAAADRAASTRGAGAAGRVEGPRSGQLAPGVVREALASPGQALDGSTRRHFETHFRQDFGGVRVHADGAAVRSAAAVGASAFTVGEDIVLGQRGAERSLLAHELAHVVQQSNAGTPWLQRQAAGAVQSAPRKNYVFLMGKDPKGASNQFFTAAAAYFRAHVPTATFVDNQRNFSALLRWISSNVSAPIGDLYIVSHGNEDGTLSFGLDSNDTDGHMTVIELRNALHPSGGGPSALTSVGSVIDGQTKIHIKGCDIGRTREIVELIDEAFGGAGTVTAPTHEQDYSVDSTLGDQARRSAHDKQIATFTAGQPALPAEPAPIDTQLKGDALKQAKKDRDLAVAARKKAQDARKAAIAAEERRIKPGLDVIEGEARTVDSLSGPMFQRPGTTLYTQAELQPEIDRLYAHLPETQRKSLATRLAAPDAGRPHDQQGQRVDRIEPFRQTFAEPASLAEVKSLFAEQFKKDHFEPKAMTPSSTGVSVTGTAHPPDAAAFDTSVTIPITVPTDATILDSGKAFVNNPGRYQWRVRRKHEKSGRTTLTAVGERVMAYLHHGSLNVKPHDFFNQPEGNSDFYATSTFAPPAPPTPQGGATGTKP